MAEEKKKRVRKPKNPEAVPVIVNHISLDEPTRTRLTEVGWIEEGEPMVNVETVRELDQHLEVLTFESGRRLITVSPLHP